MMKKLLIALAFLPIAGFSQIFTENFEGGTFPPTGWTVVNTNALENWKTYSDPAISGDASASVEYDATPAAQDEWLISPAIDLTSLPTAFLEFNISMSYYWSVDPYDNYDVFVKVSSDGGTTWSTVWDEESIPEFVSFTPFLVSINVSNFITSNNFKFAIQYVGTDGAQLVVDDFSIQETQTPPPTPPVNDDCAGAIALTAGNNFEAAAVEFSNDLATDSNEIPECSEYGVLDTWYTVVVPASGSITIETDLADGSDVDDTIIGVYTGSCGSLTSVGCNDDNEDVEDTYFSKVSLTDLTPGATLYIGVWQYEGFFGTTTGTFRIAAYDASLAAPSFDSSKFSYYPNPVKDQLTVDYTSEISDVTVFNLMGQQVLKQQLNANSGQVDVSTLSAGAYLMKVNAQDAVKTYKIVKQ